MAVYIVLSFLQKNVQYFGQSEEIFWKKYILSLHLVEWVQIWIRIGRPWIPISIRIWIGHNVADPSGSGSTTLFFFISVTRSLPYRTVRMRWRGWGDGWEPGRGNHNGENNTISRCSLYFQLIYVCFFGPSLDASVKLQKLCRFLLVKKV